MKKLKFLILILSLLFCFYNADLNIYAAKSTEESTEESENIENTENEAKDNTEEDEEESEEESEEEGDKSEESEEGTWEQDEKTGIWSFRDANNNLYKGWKKIGGYWYYFNVKGELQTNSKIGIYETDDDGILIGSYPDEFVPEPHGEIINSSSYILLNNGKDNVTSVSNQIDSTYDHYTNGKEVTKEDIQKIRYSYNSLTLSEKVKIKNEYKLAEMEIAKDISYDYDTIYATKTDATEIDEDSKVGTSYTFEISDNKNKTSILIRFTTDTDLDGLGDVPAIMITSPNGDIYEVTDQNTEVRVTDINISLTWTDNFVQLDVSNAENGNWVINTDLTCTFQQKEYAGAMQNYNPIPESEMASSSDADDEEEGSGGSRLGATLKIIAILGIFIAFAVGVFVLIKKIPVDGGSTTPKKKQKFDNNYNNYNQPQNMNTTPMTKEEEMEQLKRELMMLNEEYDYSDNEEDDTMYSQPEPQQLQYQYSEEEISESVEDYDNYSHAPQIEKNDDYNNNDYNNGFTEVYNENYNYTQQDQQQYVQPENNGFEEYSQNITPDQNLLANNTEIGNNVYETENDNDSEWEVDDE